MNMKVQVKYINMNLNIKNVCELKKKHFYIQCVPASVLFCLLLDYDYYYYINFNAKRWMLNHSGSP
jgi:hypothetical protein